jgi:hypothetical protein
MNPDHHIWHLTLSLNTARLCKRCGTVLEFEQALAEYRTWELRQTEERKAQRKKEEAERSTARDRRLARLAELASFLVEAGLRVGVNAERGMAIVEHAGREFEIKESKESDD